MRTSEVVCRKVPVICRKTVGMKAQQKKYSNTFLKQPTKKEDAA